MALPKADYRYKKTTLYGSKRKVKKVNILTLFFFFLMGDPVFYFFPAPFFYQRTEKFSANVQDSISNSKILWLKSPTFK